MLRTQHTSLARLLKRGRGGGEGGVDNLCGEGGGGGGGGETPGGEGGGGGRGGGGGHD